MTAMIRGFAELDGELQAVAGGKWAMLARMFQAGYPVPEGFVVLPDAFAGAQLQGEAWAGIEQRLQAIRRSHKGALFAVRSSGLSEDSAAASFAGEFETVLNVETDEEIRQALYTVYQSKDNERVQAYSAVQGIDSNHRIAIVVQLMVRSDISGVLFTADPITGSRAILPGNYVYGLGEQLVSGESNAYPFTLSRPRGKYEGPPEFKKYAARLYRYASRLEKLLGGPQDIEWAVAAGRIYLLQTRPITTLSPGNRDIFEVNDSLSGDYLWTNNNVGESISGVLTPLSWSVLRALDEEHNVLPGHYVFSGNICGRVYANVSLSVSMFSAFGLNTGPILKQMSRVFGEIPQGMAVPVYPFSRLELLRTTLPKILYSMKRTREAVSTVQQHLAETPQWCREMAVKLQVVTTRQELLTLWNQELWPYSVKAMWSGLEAHTSKMQASEKLLRKLSRLVGEEEARLLMSAGAKAGEELASMGPMLGISKVVRGEMSRSGYAEKYGHRSTQEFELSLPEPGEDWEWLEKQMAEISAASLNVEELLERQHLRNAKAWTRFQQRFPGQAKRYARKIAAAAEGPRLREAVRSEWTRTFRLTRVFALKAGELAGIGDDVFFLYMDEILSWLAEGDLSMVEKLPARKEMHRRYQALPPLPSLIRGRFEPFKWAADPNRRLDYYDAALPMDTPAAGSLTGFAGATGRIEGVVRVLASPEDGDQLRSGEILVAATTNVGWTPLFPKVAAIITNIGAPLSHAAIVARELGIPAVVGCANATSRLKTGDRVIVDGGQGTVHILAEG